MTNLLSRYDTLLAVGELKADTEQSAAAAHLAQVQRALECVPLKKSLFSRFTHKKTEPVRGLYLWGGVGRGKSMLMDLFVDTMAQDDKAWTRRVHFHEFMQEVHQRIRHSRETDPGDPIPKVASNIAQENRILAFDEMVVNNSADAMIMSRLFTALIGLGVTLIITSNRAPQDLYKDGLNREHFLPFIALIEEKLDIIALNGPVDYRLERLGGVATWHAPLGETATKAVSEIFFRLTDYAPEDAVHVPSAELPISTGRALHVPKSFKGVAVFSFSRLCKEARGAADYLAVARHYHSVILVGIPLMGPENRNEAARFVTLIDTLYEYHVKLFAAAAAAPEELYPKGDGAFEFERTVSRLMEMRSADYLAKGHGSHVFSAD